MWLFHSWHQHSSTVHRQFTARFVPIGGFLVWCQFWYKVCVCCELIHIHLSSFCNHYITQVVCFYSHLATLWWANWLYSNGVQRSRNSLWMCDSHSPVEHIFLRVKPVSRMIFNVTPSVRQQHIWRDTELSPSVSVFMCLWIDHLGVWLSGLVSDEALVKIMWLLGMILVCAGVKVVAKTCLSNYCNCSVCVRPISILMKLRKWQWNLFQSDQWIQECNHGKRCHLLPDGISARNVLAKFL